MTTMAIPAQVDLSPRKRGDSIYIYVNDVVDRDGVAITLSDYTLRATLKYTTDTAANDSSAISAVTSGSGITVSSNDATVHFPGSATDAVTGATTLKYEVAATKTADTTIRRTLVWGYVPIVDDITKTAP